MLIIYPPLFNNEKYSSCINETSTSERKLNLAAYVSFELRYERLKRRAMSVNLETSKDFHVFQIEKPLFELICILVS